MSVLIPMALMALLTIAYMPVVLAARIRAVRGRKVSPRYFTLYRDGEPPDDVIKTTRHLANLFETPVLFYAACLAALATGLDTPVLAGLGYAYVALRLVHMVIHTGYNNVMHRLRVFLLSTVVLAIMWVMIAVAAIAG